MSHLFACLVKIMQDHFFEELTKQFLLFKTPHGRIHSFLDSMCYCYKMQSSISCFSIFLVFMIWQFQRKIFDISC